MIKICQYFWDKMVNYSGRSYISSDRLYCARVRVTVAHQGCRSFSYVKMHMANILKSSHFVTTLGITVITIRIDKLGNKKIHSLTILKTWEGKEVGGLSPKLPISLSMQTQ